MVLASRSNGHMPEDVLSIIVPVYNEAGTVRAVLDRLLSIDLPLRREILVIDDGSRDGTGEVLAQAQRDGMLVDIVRAPENRGKGHAIRLGIDRARGSIIAIQDADLELDPQELAHLVRPILSGQASVVYGSRFLNGGAAVPLVTVVANKVLTAVTNALFGGRLTDMETCYKLMRVDVARSLRLQSDRFEIEPEITAKLLLAGHRITELPVAFQPRSRAQGKKIRWRDGMHALSVLFALRFGDHVPGTPHRPRERPTPSDYQ